MCALFRIFKEKNNDWRMAYTLHTTHIMKIRQVQLVFNSKMVFIVPISTEICKKCLFFASVNFPIYEAKKYLKIYTAERLWPTNKIPNQFFSWTQRMCYANIYEYLSEKGTNSWYGDFFFADIVENKKKICNGFFRTSFNGPRT